MDKIKEKVAEITALGQQYRELTEKINCANEELKEMCEAKKDAIKSHGNRVLISEDEVSELYVSVKEQKSFTLKADKAKEFIKFIRDKAGVSAEELSDDEIEDEPNNLLMALLEHPKTEDKEELEKLADVQVEEYVDFEYVEKRQEPNN